MSDREDKITQACENEFDGIESCELVGEILDLRTKLVAAEKELKEEKHKLQYCNARFEEVQDDKKILMELVEPLEAKNSQLRKAIRIIKILVENIIKTKQYDIIPDICKIAEQALKPNE